MPPQQGEVSLLTLFADVHYYFSPPTVKPPHHRFDKSSYVYLYHSPIQQRGRIEIANHAGTPDQDAFAGNLDTVRVEQSYKHPCLFTLTVDGYRSSGGSAAASPQQDASQWHLPTPDPQNNGRYMYRLHTVDIYFWTPDDAVMFLDQLKRVVQSHQLQITANPNDPKNDVTNPLVDKLEKAAISPLYQHRSSSISTTQSFPGPPTAPAPAPASSATPEQSTNYTPLAYNPAAPAAPEPIAHREKTPPPPDAADGTGLNQAAMSDHHHASQYGSPLQSSFAPQSTAGAPYMPGPPSRTTTQNFSGPPTPGIQRTYTTGSLPPPPGSNPSHSPGFAPPPSAPQQHDPNGPSPQPGLQRHSTMSPQYANYPGSPGHPPVQSPGFPPTPGHQPLGSPGLPPQYQQVVSPGYPPAGFSQYQYGSASQPSVQQNPYDVHGQLYRPSAQEAGVHPAPAGGAAGSGATGDGQSQGNFAKRADKLEKGVGKFLKKLDKKL